MDKKELLLMKDLEKEKNMSLADKEARKLEQKNIIKKENTSRASFETVKEELVRCFENCFDRDGLQKGFINLSLKNTRDDILKKIPENVAERNFINENYEKILNKVKKVYENDQKAKNQYITMKLKEEINKSGNIELFKKIGYKENKIYSQEDIEEMTVKAQSLIDEINKKQKEQKEEQKINMFYNIVNFLVYAFIIGIIPFLLILGYFKFAKPVFDEDKNLGYNQFETVRINPETGEKIPKNQIYLYDK